ncbi:MAG: hypothetical protein ACD_87C00268G0001 [uncultured bacterium]|nr:MAG: hypothetical protein ACD_87C00268G0001 [uncultured bacterium]
MLPELDFIGDPDRVTPAKPVVEKMRCAVAATVGAASRSQHRDLLGLTDEIKRRVGVRIKVSVGNKGHVQVIEVLKQGRKGRLGGPRQTEIRP